MLGLLYTPGKTGRQGEPITGITRVEKMAFLGLRKPALKPVCDKMKFLPDNFGPFSSSLKDDLEYLKDLGVIEVEIADSQSPQYDELAQEDGDFVSPATYRLSSNGLEVARKLWAKFDPREQTELHELKAEYNSWNLDQLVRHVYETSDRSWISRSTIAHKYGL